MDLGEKARSLRSLAFNNLNNYTLTFCPSYKMNQKYILVDTMPELPVGSIMAWVFKINRSGNSSMKLLAGWMRCDGSFITKVIFRYLQVYLLFNNVLVEKFTKSDE